MFVLLSSLRRLCRRTAFGPRRRRSVRLPSAVAVFLAAAVPTAPAIAQDAAARQRTERLLDRPFGTFVTPIAPGTTAEELLYVDTALRLTTAYLNANNNDGTSTQLFQALAQPGVRLSYAGAHEFSAVLNLDFRKYGEGDDSSETAPSGRLAQPIVNELWYRFDLGAARSLNRRLTSDDPAAARSGDGVTSLADSLRLTFGKRDIVLGSGLTLDRSLIAASAEAAFAGPDRVTLRLHAFAAKTPQESFIDFDGSRPDFDDDTNRTFLGFEVRTADRRFRPYAYLLWQFDHNDRDTRLLDIGGVPVLAEFHYQSAYAGLGFEATAGERWVYGAEAVYEWGTSASNPFDYGTGLPIDATREQISAFAASAGLTYLALDERRTRLTAQLLMGSPDRDRVSSSQTIPGNAAGTTDRAFNAFGSPQTGYVLAPELSNMLIARLGASSGFGSRRGAGDPILRAGADLFTYLKIQRDAGTSFATREGSRFVGLGLDLYAAYALSIDTTIDVRYGVFFPGDAIPDETDDVRHLVYLGLTYAF